MAPESEKDFDLEFLNTLEDGNDHYPKHEINLEARFKAASSEIKRKKKFPSKYDVEDFLHRYDDIAGNCIAKLGGNLLHVVLEMVKHTEDVESRDIELLVRVMVERWPDLLTDVDKDEHNPIFMAIRNSQNELVDYMVSSCKDNDCLNIALSKKAQAGTTCLHVAIREGIDPDTIKILVESASDEVLAVQDNTGKTPMHHAVSFNQYWDTRVGLIALFIDRDIKALQNDARPSRTYLDLRTKTGRSVYREHEWTRAQAVKKYEVYLASQHRETGASSQPQPDAARAVARSRDKVRDLRQGGSAEYHGERISEKYGNTGDPDKDLDEREKLRRRKKAEEAKKKAEETKNLSVEENETSIRNARVGDRDVATREASQARRPTTKGINDRLAPESQTTARNVDRQYEPAPNTPIRRRSTAQFDNKPDLESEKIKEKEKAREKMPPPPTPRSGSSRKKRMSELLSDSDKILLRLKQHYMRTRSAEMVISYLYGNNMEG
jgi:ankyrin repeat protein